MHYGIARKNSHQPSAISHQPETSSLTAESQRLTAKKEGASNVGERTEQVITLSLPSSMQHVNLLKVIVTEIVKETDLSEDIQEQINLAVIEAGTNSTEHSNEEEPEKQRTFQLVLAENKLTIVADDEGEELVRKETESERIIALSLPSSMQHVYLLDVVVTEILKETDFTEDIQEQINLAVIEAGTNAIKHGNKENPAKKATIQFTITEDRLVTTVKDEGAGFTRQEVADPLDPENLLKSSGRGLFLMEACMDSVTYKDNGTIIKMVKYTKPNE